MCINLKYSMCFSRVWNEIFEDVQRNSTDLQTEWHIYIRDVSNTGKRNN
jgi:hypothetical protein